MQRPRNFSTMNVFIVQYYIDLGYTAKKCWHWPNTDARIGTALILICHALTIDLHVMPNNLCIVSSEEFSEIGSELPLGIRSSEVSPLKIPISP